jgi:hypothetical protein
MAGLFRGMDWGYFVVNYAYLLAAAALVLLTPLYLQRPLAMGFYCGGLLLGLYVT